MYADRANMILMTAFLLTAIVALPVSLIVLWHMHSKKRAELKELRESIRMRSMAGLVVPGSAEQNNRAFSMTLDPGEEWKRMALSSREGGARTLGNTATGTGGNIMDTMMASTGGGVISNNNANVLGMVGPNMMAPAAVAGLMGAGYGGRTGPYKLNEGPNPNYPMTDQWNYNSMQQALQQVMFAQQLAAAINVCATGAPNGALPNGASVANGSVANGSTGGSSAAGNAPAIYGVLPPFGRGVPENEYIKQTTDWLSNRRLESLEHANTVHGCVVANNDKDVNRAYDPAEDEQSKQPPPLHTTVIPTTQLA